MKYTETRNPDIYRAVPLTAGYSGRTAKLGFFCLARPQQTNYHGTAASRYSLTVHPQRLF